MRQAGGKLLGTGSSSCVLSPNIPCKKGGVQSANRVSKLLFHDEAKKLSNYEKKQAELIKKIEGYEEWAIIYDEYCDAPAPDVVRQLDNEGYDECFKGDSFDGISQPYHPSDKAQLLNSDNGGTTLKSLFKNMFEGRDNIKGIHDNFKILMKMFIPLFKGLKDMGENNIVHNDIKSINITGDREHLKYIDFGLTSKANNIKHFKERSIKEAKTKRIYVHYPLDYLYFYTDEDKLAVDLTQQIRYRKNHQLLYNVYNNLGYDLYDECNRLYKKLYDYEYDIKEVISKIDVYSLGIQVPILFNGFKYPILDNIMISEFFDLFKLMVNPDLKARLTSSESHDMFMALIRKHNITAPPQGQGARRRKKATATKKATPKKATPKATRKATPKKATPRKATRKATPRKATRKATPPTRAATARRATARRSTARRSTARRSTARRSIPRRSIPPSRAATTRRSTTRRATPRRSIPRRSIPRRSTTRRATPRRSIPRRSIPRRSTTRRSTTRRSTTRRSTRR
jgi:hypothetical protein